MKVLTPPLLLNAKIKIRRFLRANSNILLWLTTFGLFIFWYTHPTYPKTYFGPDERSKIIETIKGNFTSLDIERAVFWPFGFKLVQDGLIPRLRLIKSQTCQQSFTDWLAVSKSINESGTPPNSIPSEHVQSFLLFRYARYFIKYRDDRSGIQKVVWNKTFIDGLIQKPSTEITGGDMAYFGDGEAIYNAMSAYPVTEGRGFVIGSLTPWAEVLALKLGAKHVTTVEYMHITTEHPQISYIHPVDLAKNYESHVDKYDFGASFSSIEHSGLGRYGDVVDPIGDLREMWKIKCMLKQGAYFFLGLPTGYDVLYWNIHRIYGRMRLAMMFSGFEIMDVFNSTQTNPFLLKIEHFSLNHGTSGVFQPVFVLRKL